MQDGRPHKHAEGQHGRAAGPKATHGQTHGHVSDRVPTHGRLCVGCGTRSRDFSGYLMHFLLLVLGDLLAGFCGEVIRV